MPNSTPNKKLARVLEQPESLVGTVLDRYQIEELIGQGGYGAVYRASHVHLGRNVALKVLRRRLDDAQSVQRFLREAKATSAISSKHVVKVFDCGVSPYPFLALEYLVGESLTSWMEREGSGKLMDALLFMDELLTGLEAAHRAGVIHRDLKPSNVFLRETKDRPTVVLLDFGIAKMSTQRTILTQSGRMMGTPRYAAPEQLRSAKHVDARADVYAAGLILYSMLSGQFPFDVSGYERMLMAIVRHKRTPLREVAPFIPRRLCHVIDQAVAFDADIRFETAELFQAALTDAVNSESWNRVSQRSLPTLPVIDAPFSDDTLND